jgi:hypothetical protein
LGYRNLSWSILTGFNEAFIISGDTKDELISKDLNSKNIIHPILRGRDINKYSVDFSDLYIIGTFPSLEIDIDKYPAVKDYLKGFGKRIEQTGEYYIDENGKRKKSRKKTNNKWFETQDSIGYIDSFFKEKIIYPNMTKYLPFFYDDKDFLTNQKCFILSSEYSKYFLPILNSKVSQYWIKNNCPELQGGTRELSKIYFENIPIPKTSSSDEKSFINNTDIMLNLHEDKKSIVGKFNRNMLRHFPEELEKLPKKLQDWYELSYADFIKELKKKKIKLSLSQESEWEDYFLDKQQKVKHLKAEIDKTYQKIDKMVYELYGLKEEEIEIVENS